MGGLFGVPGMLWWAGAAAIPVLIHLFARQRYRRVPWAAMDFLLRAFKKTRRRIRLEHLLLLLLRILAILLFVLALAEPLVDTQALLGGGDRRRDLIIVLDDSYSMGLREPDGSTTFGRARDQALRLVRSLRPERGDTVTLVTAGRPARTVLKEGNDVEKVLAEIERLELGDGSTDYLGAFFTVVAFLEDLPPGTEVFLLSDLQRVGFSPPPEGGPRPPAEGSESDQPQQILSSLVQQMLSRQATLTIVGPRETLTDNLTVELVERFDKAVVAGIPARIGATIRNFSSKPARGVVHLFVDGSSQPVDYRDLDQIPPGGAAAAAFRHVFQTPGSHTAEVRFVADSLAADNRRALAMEVRDRIRTLVVDGDPQGIPGEPESFFLASALDPGGEGVRSLFSLEVVEETAFDLADLRQIDLLVLMNVGLISRRRADDIQRFVQEGGGLLVYLGDRIQPESFNSLLWRQGTGVLPAEILEVAGSGRFEDVSFELTGADLQHPALAYFEDPAVRPWLSLPPIYRFWRARPEAESPETRVLIWFDRHGASLPRPDPAVIEKEVGKGKVILVTTSGDRDWNDIPVFPTHVLLTREIAFYLTRREARLENLLVGQGYTRVLRAFAREAVLSRDGEQLQVLRPVAQEGEGSYELRTPPLDRAGLYRLDLSEQQGGERTDPSPLFVAVNVDPREGDLARVGEDFVLANFPGEGVRYVTNVEAATPTSVQEGEGRAWWWALVLALVVLAAETALSQIFGLRTRGGEG